MKNLILKQGIRTLFFFTSRERTRIQTQRGLRDYLALAEQIRPDMGSLSVTVPPMSGVDEDMRHWSFYQIIAHNTLVNRSITATVEQLFRGESPHGPATINPKTDVMPAKAVGKEQISLFQATVRDHLNMVESLGNLRRTTCSAHPLFGDFDAHRWNCMFAFHLKIHYPQATYVAHKLRSREKSP